jgi:hypothetical protein
MILSADLQKLALAIKTTLPEVVKEWNKNKLSQFETLYEQPFEEYFKGRQTQEKTKVVAPIIDSIFARMMKNILPEFEIDEGKGRDYIYITTPLESKITFGAGDGWVGNGYTKTPWHILMRFNLKDNGKIENQFAMIANLDECDSKWSDPGTSSNFSGLKFLREDKDRLHIMVGKITDKTKTGKDAKYLTPIME